MGRHAIEHADMLAGRQAVPSTSQASVRAVIRACGTRDIYHGLALVRAECWIGHRAFAIAAIIVRASPVLSD